MSSAHRAWGRAPLKLVTTARGLTEREASERLRTHGPNHLVPVARREFRVLRIAARFATDPQTLLLVVALVAYLVLGDTENALVAGVAILPVVGVGVVLEERAERALGELRSRTALNARVWRDGAVRSLPVEQLVPGDAVVVQEGDVVPADGLLFESLQLATDESPLTGESLPVDKVACDVAIDGPGDGRSNVPSGDLVDARLLAGTTVISGTGTFAVTETGSRTEYGRIAQQLAATKAPRTPLQRLVSRLVVRVGILAVVVCALVLVVQLANGAGWGGATIAAVSLGISAAPEEFPLVYTLYLALGSRRLAAQRALVRRLPSVETLGATTIICTDKTGTLTLGTVSVEVVMPLDASSGLELLRVARLASEPTPYDLLDRAIADALTERDGAWMSPGRLVRDHPFDPTTRHVTHVWEIDGGLLVAAKGSPEGLLQRCGANAAEQASVLHEVEALAARGMRVIGIAKGVVGEGSDDGRGSEHTRVDDERGLRFVGLVGFSDPLREGVSDSLAECRRAGIRVAMITGDHPVTAHAVAERIGLDHDDTLGITIGDDLDRLDETGWREIAAKSTLFARVRPDHKLRLVESLRSAGQVVAMTGDGINDAPALRAADIGVAMGRRGTDVAREAATLVLVDDDFSTIVSAVREGRRVFANLRRAFIYLVGFHLALLTVALIVPVIDRPLLLEPVHILLLELVLHPVMSLVFEADPADASVMRVPPRRADGGMLDRPSVVRVSLAALLLAVGVVGLYVALLSNGATADEARSPTFIGLVLGVLALVAVTRWPMRTLTRTAGLVLGAAAVFTISIVVIPAFRSGLSMVPMSLGDWGLASAVAIGPSAIAIALAASRSSHLMRVTS